MENTPLTSSPCQSWHCTPSGVSKPQPLGKIWPASYFQIQVLLEHNYTCLSVCCLGLLPHYNYRDQMSPRLKIFTLCPFWEEVWPHYYITGIRTLSPELFHFPPQKAPKIWFKQILLIQYYEIRKRVSYPDMSEFRNILYISASDPFKLEGKGHLCTSFLFCFIFYFLYVIRYIWYFLKWGGGEGNINNCT